MQDYKVVSNSDKKVLESQVRQYLLDGWKLEGGISVSVVTKINTVYAFYAQALTKTND